VCAWDPRNPNKPTYALTKQDIPTATFLRAAVRHNMLAVMMMDAKRIGGGHDRYEIEFHDLDNMQVTNRGAVPFVKPDDCNNADNTEGVGLGEDDVFVRVYGVMQSGKLIKQVRE